MRRGIHDNVREGESPALEAFQGKSRIQSGEDNSNEAMDRVAPFPP